MSPDINHATTLGDTFKSFGIGRAPTAWRAWTASGSGVRILNVRSSAPPVRPPRLPCIGAWPQEGSRRVAPWAEVHSRRPDDPVLVARVGGSTLKVPGPGATRRAAAAGAPRFVGPRQRWHRIASLPRLAEHPQTQPARQRSSWSQAPWPIGVGTPVLTLSLTDRMNWWI